MPHKPSHPAGGLEAWTQKHPALPPRLRGDLASRLVPARRALDPDAEKTQPDAGKWPEGYVCQATPQSISELQGTVPRRHPGPDTATPTQSALSARRDPFPPNDAELFSVPGSNGGAKEGQVGSAGTLEPESWPSRVSRSSHEGGTSSGPLRSVRSEGT